MFDTMQILVMPNHPQTYQRREGTLGVVKLDYNQLWPDNGMYHVSRPTRTNAPRGANTLPATARFMVDKVVVMTPDIQAWIHYLCRIRCPELSDAEAKNEWRGLMVSWRAITNKAGSDTHADYINGTNLDAEPMQLQPMAMGGAVVKIIGFKTLQGVDCWEFEAIDCFGNYRQYTPLTHPWLFYQPTSSVRQEIIVNNRWTGGYRENISRPFPQYNEKSILPIFGVGMNVNYLPKWRIRILNAGEPFPSPFVY
jgi:hypothetical protein